MTMCEVMSWFSNEPRNPPKRKIDCITGGKSFNTPINSDGTIRQLQCQNCRKNMVK